MLPAVAGEMAFLHSHQRPRAEHQWGSQSEQFGGVVLGLDSNGNSRSMESPSLGSSKSATNWSQHASLAPDSLHCCSFVLAGCHCFLDLYPIFLLLPSHSFICPFSSNAEVLRPKPKKVKVLETLPSMPPRYLAFPWGVTPAAPSPPLKTCFHCQFVWVKRSLGNVCVGISSED